MNSSVPLSLSLSLSLSLPPSFAHTHTHTHTDRLVQVLEQYKERLHQLGDEGHDEELNYIKQILASPIFNDYIRDSSQLSQEETSIFSEVTNDLLSGIHETTDGQVSPAEKHKQRLQRKRSLKALRNVVTPKNSPRVKSKRSHGSGTGEGKTSSVYDGASAASPLERVPGGFSSSGTQFQNVTSPIATVVNGKQFQETPLTSRTLDHGYAPRTFSNGGIEFDMPANSGPLIDSQSRNLSNSSSTLIERSTSPSSDGTVHKRSSETLLANGGVPAGDVRHSLKTDTTLATSTAYAVGNGTGPDSIPFIGMEWDHPPSPSKQLLSSSIHDQGTPQGLKLKLPPVTHRQPPSYQLHMQSQQQTQSQQSHNPPPHHRIITSPQVEIQRPPPPPYGQAGSNNLQAQRRAKSFDRLLESSQADSSAPIHLPPLNLQPTPHDMKNTDSSPFGGQLGSASSTTPSSQYSNPIVRPMTDGVATKNFLTASDRRRTTLTVRLEKGEKGLGFRVKGLKNEQYGDLFVQDLQLGGVAER